MFQKIKSLFNKYAEFIFLPVFLLIYCVVIIFKKKNKTGKPRLIWGTDPLLINKYWSECLKEKGFYSKTLMNGIYSAINKKEDFDLYMSNLAPVKLPYNLTAMYAFLYTVYKFDIIHFPANGFLLHYTYWLKNAEAFFITWAGCKSVVLPYGSDIFMYSRINNLELRHALLLSYPFAGKNEQKIQRQIRYWVKNSNIFLPALQTDGIGYWDILCYNCTVIDEKNWSLKEVYPGRKDGINEAVKIMHTPNHRGAKGSEFIIKAVEDLEAEGLKVELVLAEKVDNETIKILMNEADILVEQLIIAHGLSAIEGMSKGLTVISNFEDEERNRVFRTYSYLNECPIVSANPENIKDVLRSLISDPELRDELRKTGRAYVEKYHSYAFGQYLFGKIYKKIWNGEDVDLLNLFHPLRSESYNNLFPAVKHPLLKNRISK